MTIALVVIGIVVAVIAAACLYFYRVAVSRSDKSFLNGNPDLTPSAEKPKDNDAEWLERQRVEHWTLTSDDGLKLHACYIPADRQTNCTAIIAHGYSGQGNLMGYWAQLYKDALGCNVLMPDARGHGKSEGHYIGFGWPERKDYVRWIERTVERHGAPSTVVLHGVSMGAATVMMASGERLPPNVRAVVADCGYTSVRDQLSYQLRRMYKLPAFPFIPVTSLLTKLRAGYRFGEASALKQVGKSRIPTLFIHGGDDTFVPTEMVYRLYAACPAPKRLLVIPGAGHGLARQTDPERYDREVTAFVSEHADIGKHVPETSINR